MTEMISKGDPVRIAVIYEPGKCIRPVWFELNHKQHKVVETTYHWRDKIGEAHYFIIQSLTVICCTNLSSTRMTRPGP